MSAETLARALNEAAELTEFISRHLSDRMGERTLETMRSYAQNWREALAAHKKEEAQAAQATPAASPRTEIEIVLQTEQLARELLLWKYALTFGQGSSHVWQSQSPKARDAWGMACRVQDLLTATDAQSAADEIDSEEGGEA